MRYPVGILALLALSLAACGTAPDGATFEPTAEARQALDPECSDGRFYSDVQDVSVQLRDSQTHFCWLTRVSRTVGNDYKVSVASDGFWYLSSGSGGEARCVPKTCFSGDGVNDEVWVSTHNISASANFRGNSCAATTNNTAWWGDAATVLRSFPGPGTTNGSGENVQVIQTSNPFSSSGIQAADCYDDDDEKAIVGRAVSLFVGTPNSGVPALFTGAQFSVSGNTTLNLGVHSDEAICYFTKIYGRFDDPNDAVRLYMVADGTRLLWHAKSTQDDGGGVKASGRCFYFNQWNK